MPLSPFHFADRFARTGRVFALASTACGLALALLPLIAGGAP